jgi:adenylate cyclase
MHTTHIFTRVKKNRNTILSIAGLASLVGAFYSSLTAGWTTENFFQGWVDGFVIGGLLAGYVILLSRDPFFRRFNFISSVGLQSLIYLSLFALGRVLGQILTRGLSALDPVSFWNPNIIGGIGLTYGIIILITFFLQINRLVGQNILVNFIIGAYHHPKAEERLFLFVDIASSTQIAEQLGDHKFHRLLNEFFYDLTDAVLETDGEIYKYVGDEIIITWKKQSGLNQGRCLRCFFLIEDRICQRKAKYQQAFGLIPSFRAGLHGGQVIAGELGDIKQEIAFIGDVLNTTARITAYCKDTQQRLLVSGQVMEQMQIPPDLTSEELEPFQPKGKQESLRIYSLRKK